MDGEVVARVKCCREAALEGVEAVEAVVESSVAAASVAAVHLAV